MFSTLKALTLSAAIGTVAAVAQPAKADHVSFGIGIGARPGRVSTVVYPAPTYFAPTFVAPSYGYAPGYYYPPQTIIYPQPTYYYGVTPYYPPDLYYQPTYYSPNVSFSFGTSFGHDGGRRLHYGRW